MKSQIMPLSIVAKKMHVFVYVAVLISYNSFAQVDRVTDSLLSVLKTTTEDTARVNILNNLSRRLWRITAQYADARKYADSALALAEKSKQPDGSQGYRKGIANAYNNIGNIHVYQGNYSEALENHLASLKIREELGDKRAVASTYSSLGVIFSMQGKYSEALKKHLAALRINEKIGNRSGVAESYNNIGTIYKLQDNYPEALKNFLATLKVCEEIGNKVIMAASYNNIGVIYTSQGNYSEALKNYLAAYKINEEIGNKNGVAMAYNNIGTIHDSQGNQAEALRNHLASLKISEGIGDKDGIASSYNNIGNIYFNQGNYPEVLKNYLASLKIREEIGLKREIAQSYVNLGLVSIRLNKFADAKKYTDKGLALSKDIGSKEIIKHAYDILAQLDSAVGNHQQALIHYRLYAKYKDSLLNESNSRQIAQMKEQYEAEKKDKEILQLESDKQKLESEKEITALLIKSKGDSLNLVQSEKEKIRLEKEKAEALNLYNQQQLALLAKERLLQQLVIEKNEADLLAQKAETEKKELDFLAQKALADKKQQQLTVSNKEKALQDLQLKKQKQAKNYFIAGLGLFVVLSFFVYRNYHNRQQLKLLELRNKIARDLHDDVGSTLSSISIFSQMAQQQSKETIPMLETIGESSRKMLDAMADIVWTINPENDQFEKIIMRMRSFAYELLGAKKIDFEFVADDEVSKFNVPMEVRKNLYLIFKEATNNMVKYANANKAVFAIKGQKNNLTMTIQDNGRGFDLNKSREGNGLKNMKRRANEIGARLIIESFPGNGTTVQLSVAV